MNTKHTTNTDNNQQDNGMTKEQAIAAMKEGKKVTHRYFLADEWITMLGNIIRMEQGQECWSSEFWKDREGESWETGWSIFGEHPTPTPVEVEDDLLYGITSGEWKVVGELNVESKDGYVCSCGVNSSKPNQRQQCSSNALLISKAPQLAKENKALRSDMLNAVRIESELRQEVEKVNRLLHDLTPGGSEFYNNPEYCAKWITETIQQESTSLKAIIREKKQEIQRLSTLNGELLDALQWIEMKSYQKDEWVEMKSINDKAKAAIQKNNQLIKTIT